MCLREDLAKENIMSSQEPSQAIFEMGTVELIELQTSRIQCPSCLHYVYKGTILCACGKHVRPDQEMRRRIKLLKYSKHPTSVRLCLLQGETNTGQTYGREHQHKAKDAPRGTTKNRRNYTSIKL